MPIPFNCGKVDRIEYMARCHHDVKERRQLNVGLAKKIVVLVMTNFGLDQNKRLDLKYLMTAGCGYPVLNTTYCILMQTVRPCMLVWNVP
jgi:hypothetical protein